MKKILVVGDVILDYYVMGDTTRISPEAPVPVVNVAHEEIRLGGAANVAANIAAMGGDVTLMFLAGNDPATRQLTEKLTNYPIKLEPISSPDFSTIKKTRIIAANQQIVRIDRDFFPSAQQQLSLFEAYKRIVSNFDILVFSDYAKGTLDRLPEFLSNARALKKQTLVDPKRSDPSFYSGATVLKPNNREFNLLFGDRWSSTEAMADFSALLDQYSLGSLLITRGEKGMVIIEPDKPKVELPTFAREVFDVSGAGDTVLAALAVAIARQDNLVEAATFANIAAGIAVSHRGTYVVTLSDLKQELLAAKSEAPKIVEAKQLPEILNPLKKSGKKIVFTNGCFDILHPGHVRLLREARSLGDALIVGLNSDASVSGLKGPKRPVNTLSDRAEVLAGLSSVDYVIEFDAPTPYELIKAILPDILVKGGDYAVKDIVGHDVVEANGGKVYSLKFHEGHSTTKIIDGVSQSK